MISQPSVNLLVYRDIPFSDIDFLVDGQWITILDIFLTNEECTRLIEVGAELGRATSSVEADVDDDDDN